jgi:hypothetical protein
VIFEPAPHALSPTQAETVNRNQYPIVRPFIVQIGSGQVSSQPGVTSGPINRCLGVGRD